MADHRHPSLDQRISVPDEQRRLLPHQLGHPGLRRAGFTHPFARQPERPPHPALCRPRHSLRLLRPRPSRPVRHAQPIARRRLLQLGRRHQQDLRPHGTLQAHPPLGHVQCDQQRPLRSAVHQLHPRQSAILRPGHRVADQLPPRPVRRSRGVLDEGRRISIQVVITNKGRCAKRTDRSEGPAFRVPPTMFPRLRSLFPPIPIPGYT